MASKANAIIMTLLFLGVLLLIIGYFYFYHEGFQNPSTPASTPVSGSASGLPSGEVNTCVTGSTYQKCSKRCFTDPLRSPTDNEETAYSIYETQNLVDAGLNMPPVALPSSIPKYNTAGLLTANDITESKSIPWDFDNMSLNPATSLWGTVHSMTSRLLYAKCQSQALYEDINNLDYDPTTGLFSYKSLLFGEIYDQREAASLQFGEMFINMEVGKWIGKAFERVNEVPGEYIDGVRTNRKEAQFKLEQQISDYKNARQTKTAAESVDVVAGKAARGEYDTAWHLESQKTSAYPMAASEKVPGTDYLKRLGFNWGRQSMNKSPLNIDYSNAARAQDILEDLASKDVDEDIKAQRKFLSREGITETMRSKYFKDFNAAVARRNNEANNKPVGLGTLYKRITDLIPFGSRVVEAAALRRNLIIAMELAKHAVSRAGIDIAGTVITGIIGAYIAPPLLAFLIALQLACNTFVGPLLASFIEDDAVCPRNRNGSVMWNFDDYFQKNPEADSSKLPFPREVGEVILSVLQATPFIGSAIAAFGPYLCYADDLTNHPIIRFKNNLRWPPYYFDPTLSIYSGGSASSSQSLRKNQGSKPKFEAGTNTLDDRLFNPLTFHYNRDINIPTDEYGNPGYPVWVDFANPKMLNKMAQFYYDASRKNPVTTADGMLTVEYISKFMGLISTTALTCDVQCEISQITFDPESGVKICETVVPTEPGNLSTLYHDRRFYFYRDMTKSRFGIAEATEAQLAQMSDQIALAAAAAGATAARAVGAAGSVGTVVAGARAGAVTSQERERARVQLEKDRTTQSINNRKARIATTDITKLTALMKDNMDIYIVTGCTFVDGTAPDCMTYNSEGQATTNPVISLGPPSGIYTTPEVKIGSPNLIPTDSNCGNQGRFMRFGGSSHPAAREDKNTNNTSAIIGNGPQDDWIYAYKDYNPTYWYPSDNIATEQNLVATPEILKTTKYWSIVWNNTCKYDDNNCQINSRESALGIVQGTMEGLIGCGFGIGEVQSARNLRGRRTSASFDARSDLAQLAGGLVQTGLNVDATGYNTGIPGDTGIGSFSERIRCTYEQLTAQSGTYIMNGRVMTSQKGFVVDHGPFINWAPGYTPTIQYCKEQTIELYDCVNPYAVRRFVEIYHTQFTDKQIKKIQNISPRLDTGSQWRIGESKAMCVYNIDVAQFDPIKFAEKPDPIQNITIGLHLQQMTADKTCAFVPLCRPSKTLPQVNVPYPAGSSNMNYFATGDQIYPPAYFTKDGKEPEWEPENAVNLPATDKFNCNTKKQSIIDTFNLAHENMPKFISATETLNITTIGGQHMCLFKGLFGSVYNPATRITENPTNDPLQAKERNVTIMLDDVSGNYETDDFPQHYTYTPIPKRSTWFDVPPRVPLQASSTTFARAGCAEDPIYNDCSNAALIDILVTQYNEANNNSKILKVLRSFTPVVADKTVCDYDVERLKTIGTSAVGTSTVVDRETIRFFLEPAAGRCTYKLKVQDTNANSVTINSGNSLNLSDTLGILATPYTTAMKYSTGLQQQFFSAMSKYIGYDIPATVNNSTTNMLNTVNTLRASLYSNKNLKSCPDKTCMDRTVMTAMINRYNFDAYPTYPPRQNTVTKNTIVRVRKTGTATSTSCEMQLYVRTDFFTDFLYTPLARDTQYFMRDFAFKLIATPTRCTFKVRPFTPTDISEATMDISGNAFSLDCPVAPATCPSVLRGNLASFANNDYKEAMIPCVLSNSNDPVLQYIKTIYNTTPIFTKSGTGYYNTINKVTRVFNAMPNVIELKVTTKRVYWDSAYSTAYYTGTTTDTVEESYIIATWPEGTEYEVETGYYWKDSTGAFVDKPTTTVSIEAGISKATVNNKIITMCRPTLQEIFYPDLTFTATAISKTNLDGSLTPVFLPYLANDGLIGLESAQKPRYASQ
jgi:hypothetical protein